jgi:cytochrome P450
MPGIASAVFRTVQRSGSFLDRVVNGSPIGDPKFKGDAYSLYARLLANGPLVRGYLAGGWNVLSFQAVQKALRDPRFSADVFQSPSINRVYQLAARGNSTLLDNPLFVSTDPPEHTRLRKLARRGFLHRYVQSLEPTIRRITDECLINAQDRGQFDLVATLARPLPANLMSYVLGIDPDDRDRFRHVSEVFTRSSAIVDLDLIRQADGAFKEMLDLMEGVVAKRQASPGDDLISNLVAADEEGDRLTAREVTSMGVLLMFAGYETTMRLIGNAVYLLLRHPAQMKCLREHPALIANALEEVLRFEPPTQFVARTALQDVDFFGKRIRKNQLLILIIASANRDPAANENPHEFNVRRENINHIAFGHGIHLCLGAELARLESRIALEALLERFPHLSLGAEPRWEPGYWVRGLEELILDTTAI